MEDAQDVLRRVMNKEDARIANKRATQTSAPVREPPEVDTAPAIRAMYQELVPIHANRHSLNTSMRMRKFISSPVSVY